VKIYCENCGSTQFLRHLGGCEAWKVAVEQSALATQEAVARTPTEIKRDQKREHAPAGSAGLSARRLINKH